MHSTTSTDDIVAFNKLYREFQPRFIRFANSYVSDLVIAEDITVEALIYYWENKHLLDPNSNVSSYILSTIKHKCLNYLRHQRIKEDYAEDIRSYKEWELKMRIDTLQACDPNELLATEMQEIIVKTIFYLPKQTQLVFQMSRYENKTHKEIAQQLDISIKGVEYHISKALKAFRNNLKDYFLLFLLFFPYHH